MKESFPGGGIVYGVDSWQQQLPFHTEVTEDARRSRRNSNGAGAARELLLFFVFAALLLCVILSVAFFPPRPERAAKEGMADANAAMPCVTHPT